MTCTTYRLHQRLDVDLDIDREGVTRPNNDESRQNHAPRMAERWRDKDEYTMLRASSIRSLGALMFLACLLPSVLAENRGFGPRNHVEVGYVFNAHPAGSHDGVWARVPEDARAISMSAGVTEAAATAPVEALDLQRFSRLDELQLDLHGECEVEIKNAPATLRHVRFHLWHPMGRYSRAFQSLVGLAGLETLSVSGTYLDVAHLAVLPLLGRVSSLELHVEPFVSSVTTFGPGSGVPAGQEASTRMLEHVAAMEGLTRLRLDRFTISLDAASSLSEIASLQSISGTAICDVTLQALARSESKLEELDLSENQRVSDFGMQSLPKLKALRKLSVAGCRCVGDYALPYITKCEKLEELDLSASPSEFPLIPRPGEWGARPAYAADFEARSIFRTYRLQREEYLTLLPNLGNLRTLKLRGIPTLLGRVFSEIVRRMVHLEELDISGCSIRDVATENAQGGNPDTLRSDLFDGEDLSYLNELVNLRCVRASLVGLGWAVDGWHGQRRRSPSSDQFLIALAKLPKIEYVEIRSAKPVSSEALAALLKAPRLRGVDMAWTRVVGDIRPLLPRLRKLETLGIALQSNQLQVEDVTQGAAYRNLILTQCSSLEVAHIDTLVSAASETLDLVYCQTIPIPTLAEIVSKSRLREVRVPYSDVALSYMGEIERNGITRLTLVRR